MAAFMDAELSYRCSPEHTSFLAQLSHQEDALIKVFTLARYVHRSDLPMKVFFQTLLPKASRAEAPDPNLDNAKARGKAISMGGSPQKTGASGKAEAPTQGGEAGRSTLALEAGDFIDRVPHHLLRFGYFDLHQPLLFEMSEIADRIARGVFTIPLSDLLKLIPEMFVEDAQAQHALEVRFPWQRVMQMVNESAATHKEDGGETLAHKLRRLRKANRPAAPAPVKETPVESRQEAAPQIKRGAGRDGENAWFSKRAITFEGGSVPVVPDSAPALFELPESKAQGPNGPSESAPAVSKAAPPAVPPVPPVPPAAPAPHRQPKSDLMNLEGELRLVSAENTEAKSENIPAAASAAKPDGGDSEQKRSKMKIAFLEAQLKTLSTKHQNEVAMLKAEADRLVEKARAEKEAERRELVAQFQFERQRLAEARDEQLAKMEAEHRAGGAAQENQISPLGTAGKVTGEERRDSAAEVESRQAEIHALEARVASVEAELASVKSERDHVAGLLSREEQRAEELSTRLEFDLFALRVESAQIVEEERERAHEKIAELESRFAQERAAWQDETERQRPASDDEKTLAAKDLENGETVARLRDELEKAEALAAAQADAHERVAAQWEEDMQSYRKRIQAVLGEKTILAAKLREAEIALQATSGSLVGSPA